MPKCHNIALIGAAGNVAPRHMQAIKDTGNLLVAACDPHDSVDIIDSYFRDCEFYSGPEPMLKKVAESQKGSEDSRIDCVVVASPTHLHMEHIGLAFEAGANVVCENPVSLALSDLDAIAQAEKRQGRRFYAVLPFRFHPTIQFLKQKASKASSGSGRKHRVSLKFISSRGRWYHASWQGDPAKSGGLGVNMGIELFDVLLWVFGRVEKSEIVVSEKSRMAGRLELEHAIVDWFLSLNEDDLPEKYRLGARSVCRYMSVDDIEQDFSRGFTHLRTRVYEDIMAGFGTGVEDARPSLSLVQRLR